MCGICIFLTDGLERQNLQEDLNYQIELSILCVTHVWLEIPGVPNSSFLSCHKWEWVSLTHYVCSVYINPFFCSQGRNFFLKKLFMPARFFHIAYEKSTPYVVKKSAGTNKDSLVLLNRTKNPNASMQFIYPQRDPSLQSSTPQMWSSIPSVHSSPSSFCPDLTLTGRGKCWIP